MGDKTLDVMGEQELELVVNSPESVKSIAEEALEVAEYINKRKLQLPSATPGCTDSDSDSDVPTATLLDLGPELSQRRRSCRTVMTQELQDMFGFEATPVSTVPKRKRVRQKTPVVLKTLPQFTAVVSDRGSTAQDVKQKLQLGDHTQGGEFIPKSEDFNSDTHVVPGIVTRSRSKSSSQPLPKASASNANRQTEMLQTTNKNSSKAAPTRSNTTAYRNVSDIQSKTVTARKSTLQPSASLPQTGSTLARRSVVSKIDTGRNRPSATPVTKPKGVPATPTLANDRISTKPKLAPSRTAAVRKAAVAVSKIDTGRGTPLPSSATSRRMSSAAHVGQSTPFKMPVVPAPTPTYKKPVAVSRIDTGRHSISASTSNIRSKSSVESCAVRATPRTIVTKPPLSMSAKINHTPSTTSAAQRSQLSRKSLSAAQPLKSLKERRKSTYTAIAEHSNDVNTENETPRLTVSKRSPIRQTQRATCDSRALVVSTRKISERF